MNEQSISRTVHPPFKIVFFSSVLPLCLGDINFYDKNSLTSPWNYLKFSKDLSFKQLLREVANEWGITCFYVSTLTLNILVDRQTM